MCQGPWGRLWPSWQDVALGHSDMSPASLGDRGLCVAWASDQTLPQSQATLFSELEARTNTRGKENPCKGHQ